MPDVGKTTVLREMAYEYSRADKITCVVYKTNEIAGDADTPHHCIGEARWLPCTAPGNQPTMLLDAVQDMSPEVIIVDEISDFDETKAARTISEQRCARCQCERPRLA